MKSLTQQVYRSSGFYPIATFWVVSCLVAYLLARAWLGVLVGFLLLLIAAILAALAAAWREIATLREMMDGQRTEMLERLDEMTRLLRDNGIPPPEPGPKEQEAREQDELVNGDEGIECV